MSRTTISRFVLDTNAFVLYLLAGEDGEIQRMLRDAETGRQKVLMNAYNLAEVYVRLAPRLSEEQLDEVVRVAQALPIRWIAISDDLVFSAARLRANYEIDAAAAIAVATAMQENAILVTPEPLAGAMEGVSVRPLRNIKAEALRELNAGQQANR